MYYPYLIGREMELAAIKNRAAALGSPQIIAPVIEPALKPDAQLPHYVGKLTRTFAELKKHHAVAYLVVNPRLGKFAGPAVVGAWWTAMADTLNDDSVTIPAFKVRTDTTAADVVTFAAAYPGRPLALVVDSETAVEPDVLAAAVPAGTLVFLSPGVDSLKFVAAFGTAHVVRVMNNFPAKARNADYTGEEPLATNHQTYLADGAPGFSDYTVLSPQVSFSGGPAGAAAIHLSYQNSSTGAFWVQHFVSDETDVKEGTFQSKLLEAIGHLDSTITTSPSKFPASPSIADYLHQLTTSTATSQGKNKQLQIEHHLHAVADYLGI